MAKPQYRWPPGLRTLILTRDNNTCQIQLPGCTTKATALDHKTPTSQGGEWFNPNNLRAACKHCNTALSNPQAHHHHPKPSRQW